jgi:hypothetical protein
MDMFLIVYGGLGLLTLLFMATNYGFLEGTPLWRKIIAFIFAVILWPVLILLLAIEGR